MLNWANNHAYRASRVHFPKSVEEVQAIVRNAKRVRGLGSRHSFNAVADSEAGELISLKNLDRFVRFETREGRSTVTFEAGMNYGQLCPLLDSAGYAVHNLASLPHISVIGACMTGTHGSGDAQPGLASAVSAITFVDADGRVQHCSREEDPDEFDGMVVSLGTIGIVVDLTLDLIPTFEVAQTVYENVPIDALRPQFDAVTSSTYSISLFTDWQGGRFNQVWMKSVTGRPHFDLRTLGATIAPEQRHPVQGAINERLLTRFINPSKCTVQLGIGDRWHKRLSHFRIEDEPSTSGAELQAEYLIGREHALAAFDVLFGMADEIRPFVQISEVRTMAADRLWMSPFYDRPSVGIHFTCMNDRPAELMAVLAKIEERFEPFAPRPHWGKLFAMGGDRVRSRYPQADAFRQLIRRYDPNGKFGNAFVDRNIG